MSNQLDSVYDLKLKRLVLLMLPLRWHKPVLGALIMAGATGLEAVVQQLRLKRDAKEKELRYTGQVCRLRAALNDEFDPLNRRLTVMDAQRAGMTESSRIYVRSETRALMVNRRGESGDNDVVYGRGYGGSGGVDFWVEVPKEIVTTGNHLIDISNLIAAKVNRYRLAGMRWRLKVM